MADIKNKTVHTLKTEAPIETDANVYMERLLGEHKRSGPFRSGEDIKIHPHYLTGRNYSRPDSYANPQFSLPMVFRRLENGVLQMIRGLEEYQGYHKFGLPMFPRIVEDADDATTEWLVNALDNLEESVRFGKDIRKMFLQPDTFYEYMTKGDAEFLAKLVEDLLQLQGYTCNKGDFGWFLRIVPVNMYDFFLRNGWPNGIPQVDHPLPYNGQKIPGRNDWCLAATCAMGSTNDGTDRLAEGFLADVITEFGIVLKSSTTIKNII